MADRKLSEDIQQFLMKTTTVNFLHSARQFVGLLELNDIDKTEFLKKSHTVLVELYATGYKFEEIPLHLSADSDFDRDGLFINKNARRIADLGMESFYREVFDPTYTEQDEEPGESQGCLVDDFDDIYRDLKIELTKIDSIATNEAVEDALWQLKWGFFNHWGQHCINAMRYLHYYCYNGKSIM